MKIVALIPLRGGSKSIPYKNIKEIGRKPLAYWTCKAAVDAPFIDEVYVSTEDPKIKAAVEAFGLGVKFVDRPLELAGDLTTTDAVMMHFLQEVPDFDLLFTIQATSPLTTAKELEEGLNHFTANEYDSMLTGVRVKRFFWTDEGVALNYDYKNRPMRQQFNGTIMENGAFYITKKEVLERDKNRLGGKIGVFEMPAYMAAELDEPEDWEVLEKILLDRESGK
jgi:N-acylneuraminate cytidylyltransferase